MNARNAKVIETYNINARNNQLTLAHKWAIIQNRQYDAKREIRRVVVGFETGDLIGDGFDNAVSEYRESVLAEVSFLKAHPWLEE